MDKFLKVSGSRKKLAIDYDSGLVRILTYNVNGIRSFLKKEGTGFHDFAVRSNADIICLQETKMDKKGYDAYNRTPHVEHLDSLAGWRSFWCFHETAAGRSGTVTFVRNEINLAPAAVVDVPEPLTEEGRTVVTRIVLPNGKVMALFNLYVPNTNNLDRIPYKKQWLAELRSFLQIVRAQGDLVVITGDLNACLGPEDASILKGTELGDEMESSHGFKPFEREWVEELTDVSGENTLSRAPDKGVYVDAFRLIHPVSQLCPPADKYTWYNYLRQGWRIDYFLVDRLLASHIRNCEAKDQFQYSDHVPLFICLKF